MTVTPAGERFFRCAQHDRMSSPRHNECGTAPVTFQAGFTTNGKK